MSKEKILIVDDEEIMRNAVKMALEEIDDIVIDVADDGLAASKKIEKNDYSVVISDIRMPGMGGIDLLKLIKEKSDNTFVIMMTAYGSVDLAVRGMKMGAYDFITKPFSYEIILEVVKKALKHRKELLDNPYRNDDPRDRAHKFNIIGESTAMQELFSLIDRVSKSDANIFLYGESGTGKSMVARAIHDSSFRTKNPFVSVNCAALPETLLESELFGHVTGAFTGAIKDRPGRFELAQKGTIFLDEIGEISPFVQVKLLRVTQEKSFERVGDIKTLETDVRIITATNRDLKKEVKEGRFREDLYYRLNVIPIEVPPLRTRGDDVEILANHFLNIFNTKNNKRIKNITSSVMEKFKSYAWPGNVRELENAIERMVVLEVKNELTESFLPSEIRRTVYTSDSDVVGEFMFNSIIPLQELEKIYILHALDHFQGNFSKTSRALEIDRKTLYNKLNKYGIKSER